jgi:hypothetical protein
LGGTDRRIAVGEPGQNLARPYLRNKPGVVAHPCYLGGRRIPFQGQLGQKHETLSEKQTKRKRTGWCDNCHALHSKNMEIDRQIDR